MADPELITTIAAAKLLACSSRTVHRLVTSGELEPALRLASGGPNGTLLFRRAEVERVARERAGSAA